MIEEPTQYPDNREPNAPPSVTHFAPPVRETGVMLPSPDPWTRADIAAGAEPPAVRARERIFSRRVLIGWATVTLVAYFGIHFIGRIMSESIHRAIVSSVREVQGSAGRKVEILLPNGKRIVITPDAARRPPPLPGADAADVDPDPNVDIQLEPTASPQPATLPGTKKLPDAKAAAPVVPKGSPTRR